MVEMERGAPIRKVTPQGYKIPTELRSRMGYFEDKYEYYICGNCGELIAEDFATCPFCSANLNQSDQVGGREVILRLNIKKGPCKVRVIRVPPEVVESEQ